MHTQNKNVKALDDIRVLDLAGPSGFYCTKLLADLGADVIKIEPPGGDHSRHIGPFYHDEPHPEKSLYFFHYNTNKRSITLNIETQDGRDIFKKLVQTSDILIETFTPNYLDSIGLGYPVLEQINPKLIMVSITGFGQTGPYKDFEASDIIGLATGGLLYTMGFPEDPPTSLGASQGYHMASANAAIGALIALYSREITGEGQWVDVAMQGAVLRMTERAPLIYWLTGAYRQRSGLEYYRGMRDIFPCKDGRIVCSALGGSGADVMLDWMESEGMVADLRDEKYNVVLAIMTTGSPYGGGSQQRVRIDVGTAKLQDYPDEVRHIEEVWERFLMTHTKEELFTGAQNRGVKLMPLNNARDIVEDIGLKERNYFAYVEHPELGETIQYPGAPYRFSETPWQISKRAPLCGEHNMMIYEKELGFTREQLSLLKASNVI
jgi:benzylsuccinate CoA-transferase BbsE subunit